MKTTSTQQNWKKYFYSGIGHISHTGDVVQRSIKEISQRGKVNEADGRDIVINVIRDIEKKYNEAIHKFMDATSLETAKIQSRLTKLEKQLSIKPGSASKLKAVAKTTTKKQPQTHSKTVLRTK